MSDCKMCEGSGEIETEMNGERQTVGCPTCIEQQKDDKIKQLETQLRLTKLADEFDAAPDSAAWGLGHPIFNIAQENDNLHARVQQLESELAGPVDVILYCPRCRTQHVDEPDLPSWANPPHKSHLCHACGDVWRPCDRPTNGVKFVKTKGSADLLDMRDPEQRS